MPAELFSIVCTTCHARLKVHDRKVIGEILTCPKCTSMVHIIPPKEWSAAGNQALHETPSMPLSMTPPPLPSKEFRRARATPPPLPISPYRPGLATMTPVSFSRPGHVAEGWLAMASAGLGGIVIGLGVWLVLVAQRGSEPENPQHAVAWENVPPAEDLKALLTSDAEAAPELAPANAAPASVAQVPASPVDQSAQPAPTSPLPVASSVVSATAHRAARPPVSAQPAVSAQPPKEPSSAAIAKVASSPSQPPASAPAKTPEAKFKVMAPYSAVGSPAIDKAVASQPLTPKPRATAANTAAASPVQTKTPLDVRQRLTDKLTGIEFRATPLSEFVLFMSELSTIPIELDKAGLARAGKTPATLVAVRMKNTTVAKALEAAVAPHQLIVRVEPTKLVITAAK